MTDMKKKEVVSNVLRTGRNWHNVSDKLPDPGKQVVIRFTNENIIYAESKTEIYPSEDMKIGRYVRDINDVNKGKWVIDPPFPKYDYSPLSDGSNLKEGAHVTHWAEATDEDIMGWNTRFDLIGDYHYLNLEVDPEYEETVYRALIHGSSWIARAAGKDFENDKTGEMRLMYSTLCDLQMCIDKGVAISDGTFIKNSDLEEVGNSSEDEVGIGDVLTSFARLESDIENISDSRKKDIRFMAILCNRAANLSRNISKLCDAIDINSGDMDSEISNIFTNVEEYYQECAKARYLQILQSNGKEKNDAVDN